METKHKLVYLEWVDAISHEGGWSSLEDAIDWADNDDWTTIEVGFIIKETKEYILFANKMGLNPEHDTYGGLFKIPKTWVRNRIDLTKHIENGNNTSN